MSPSSTQQFSGIFISYRRDDAAGHAGRLADRLVEHFGRDRIFRDIDNIEPGEDFVTVIENAVGSCDILIAVIGRNWNSATSSGRLDNPNDFVRLEIATALRRDIRVIPVLVQRASMPKPEDLPDDLDKLTRRNAVELTDLRWQSDVDQLISVLERVLAKRGKVGQLAEENDSDEEQEQPDVEERHVGKEPVDLGDRENQLDAPAKLVTARTAPPPNKHRLLVLIAGASLMVLLAVSILIWRAQKEQTFGNTDHTATPEPTLATQPGPAKPAPTPELKSSPSPEPAAFGQPTLWKKDDTGTILLIVRVGNSLRAIVDTPSKTAEAAGRNKGDLAFEGSYERRTIKGKAYLRFSPKDVSRCPAFGGEQPFNLELRLSADGNKLSGSREDYELSDDCKIINPGRRKLSYTRTSP